MAREWLDVNGYDRDGHYPHVALADLLAKVRAEGVKAERAAIVAWLREDKHDDAAQLEADAVERGDHVTPREAEEGGFT